MTDAYRGFAEVYDSWQLLYPKAFSVAVAPRVVAVTRARGTPVPVLADIACGTGIFAFWWQRTHRSWRVYGSDLSPRMIAAARRASGSRRAPATASARPAPSRGAAGPVRRLPRPVFSVQDMRALSLPEPAGIITCLFDSLNHLVRESDLRRTFRRVAAALAPGGLFVFDLVDDLAFPELFTGTSILDGRNLFVGIATTYAEERGIGIGRARFTFFRPRGSGWKRIEFDVKERRWFRGEVREMLHAAGLDLLGVERIDPYTSEDFFVPRTFWTCRKSRR